jgi:hypothetical protein
VPFPHAARAVSPVATADLDQQRGLFLPTKLQELGQVPSGIVLAWQIERKVPTVVVWELP